VVSGAALALGEAFHLASVKLSASPSVSPMALLSGLQLVLLSDLQ
jgi:hypothetical protein